MRVDDVVVLHDSNRLALRLLPCDVLARVAHMEGKGGAEFEVEVARRLAETGSPVASLDPRVVPRVYARDGRERRRPSRGLGGWGSRHEASEENAHDVCHV